LLDQQTAYLILTAVLNIPAVTAKIYQPLNSSSCCCLVKVKVHCRNTNRPELTLNGFKRISSS